MAVAAASEIVFTSLPGPKEVEAVALGEAGILQGAAQVQSISIFIQIPLPHSTYCRRLWRTRHVRFGRAGERWSDQPQTSHTGSNGGRRWCSLRSRQPILDAIGNKVSYVGPIGAGAIAKLVHNMIGICTQAILAEGLTLGVKAGVDPEPVRKAIADGAVGQGLMLNYMVPNVIFKGDFDTPRLP